MKCDIDFEDKVTGILTVTFNVLVEVQENIGKISKYFFSFVDQLKTYSKLM